MGVRHFWQEKSLAQLSLQEWESLCDGCAKCCLVKLEDEDTGDVHYTDVACRYLDSTTCRCTTYFKRVKKHPDCIQLTSQDIPHFHWLPDTCAYRLIAEDKPLPKWHHLMSGDKNTVHAFHQSVANKTIGENEVKEHDLQAHIIRWVDSLD